MTQTFFERKIKPILLYVGTIGAIMMSIGYIVLMFVLVLGFKSTTSLTSSIMFALVNAIVGFIIMQFLKIQGIDFAKQLPNNLQLIEEYNRLIAKKPKKKKHHTLKYFWTKSIIGDALGKALMTAISTAGIIYIVIEGSNDYNMILLSVVNLILFACFGLISLVRAYEFYNEQYIPYIGEQIYEIKETNQQANNKEKTKRTSKQRKSTHCSDSRDNILESSVGMCSSGSNSESMVLDSSDSNNSILVCSIDSSNTSSTGMDSNTKQNIQTQIEK